MSAQELCSFAFENEKKNKVLEQTLKHYLIVQDHHIVTVCIHPRVHSFADAADLIQGWSVMVRPAKIQHLTQANTHETTERNLPALHNM